MKERIRELAEQAVEETQLRMIMEYKNFESKLYEKFAELIVHECISVGNRAFLADNSVVPTFPTNQIKEHFGVK